MSEPRRKPFDGQRHGAQRDAATRPIERHETAPAVDFVNAHVERGLAELKHALIVETRELGFDLTDARGDT